MKFLIAFIAFAIISSACSAGKTTKKPAAEAPPAQPVDPVTGMINLINTYPGNDLKAYIGNLAKTESNKYPQKFIDGFCADVCKQLTSTSKISCDEFTSTVKTNCIASGTAK